MKKHYGDVERQARIGNGPYCDKAWHLDGNAPPVFASHVLRCSECTRKYARCEDCNKLDSVRTCMSAHFAFSHRQNIGLRRRIMPRDA